MLPWLKTMIKVILGGIVAFALFGAAIVGIAFWGTSAMIDPIDRQIAALKAGDMPSAYAETSEAFRQATSMADFVAFVESYPILRDVASHSFLNRSYENDLGMVEGTLTSSTGGVVPATYKLVRENDAWKIISISLGAAGAATAAGQ